MPYRVVGQTFGVTAPGHQDAWSSGQCIYAMPRSLAPLPATSLQGRAGTPEAAALYTLE